uniref:Uncharacterized protein n=1 Tax=Salix viminalis TaxID=40686 RepID=A0A6N2LM23_SALVM
MDSVPSSMILNVASSRPLSGPFLQMLLGLLFPEYVFLKCGISCKQLFKLITELRDGWHEVHLIATSLRDQLKTNKAFSSTCCIYRVTETLRESNEKAYAPRVVSIGPIHHGKENLKAMEDHKITYLRQFLEQSEVSVEDLINIVRDNDTELRDCYAETIDLSRNDFATMILLDVVFIITVLLYSYDKSGTRESGSGDHKFFRPWELFDVIWDMCLLENQLPFFILEEFFKRYSNANASLKNRTVIELTSQLLHEIMAEWVKEDSWKTINSSEVLHFVDLIRKCQKPTKQSCEDRETAILSAPTATELHQSGVKLTNTGSKSLLDIRFSDGILEIPQLTIHARTETLFRNLQAFEQCHYMSEDRFVSDYITFISCLVIAPNDVEVLVHNENLKNLLNNGFLIGVCDELTSHCKKRRHKWKATLKQVYFNNPWTAISVAAATFLLILTLIQSVVFTGY